MRAIMLILATLICIPQFAVAQSAPLFTPHIEHYTQGWIDWDKGIIYASGRAYADHNGGSRIKALGAAQLVAAANIVKLASGIHLDDRHTLEKLGHGTFALKLTALLHYREQQRKYVKNVSRPYAEVVLSTPMHGVEGLTAQLLTQLKKQPLQWQKYPLHNPVTNQNNGDEPWLVIDTRQLPKTAAIKPSLFPKIETSSGQTIYDLNKVYQAAQTERGLARYVHSNASADEIMLSMLSGKPTPWQLWANWLNPVSHAWATSRSKRPRYILTSAHQVSGMARTNLVISNYDAQRLRQEDATSKILKDCRVIIITSAPIGGIEGRNSTNNILL